MQSTDRIYIVAHGRISFYSNLDNINEFEVMSLGRDTVINHRNVFIDSELFRFHAIATEETTVYEITKETLMTYQKQHERLGRQIDIDIANILKKKKRYILDIIPSYENFEPGMLSKERRSIAFKNVAFQLMFD
jgi:CRP-like cAMP-binding protein